MKLEVNIEKRYALGIIASVLVLAGVLLVLAYDGPIPNPGHDADRVWVDTDGIMDNGAGEMTLQDAVDSAEIPSVVLCSHNVGTSGPCFEASKNQGSGTSKYRAINCLNPNDRVVARAIRYWTSNTWQYFGSDGNWFNCQEGSVLVVKIAG